MSKNTCRMIGLIMELVSVFLIIGGLYLESAELPAFAAPVCFAAGIILLIAGIIFYHIVKSD